MIFEGSTSRAPINTHTPAKWKALMEMALRRRGKGFSYGDVGVALKELCSVGAAGKVPTPAKRAVIHLEL